MQAFLWNKFQFSMWFYILILAVGFVAIQIGRVPGIGQSLAFTYITLAIIPVTLAICLRSKFPKWVEDRRRVPREELQGLFSDVELYSAANNNGRGADFAKQAATEKQRLENTDHTVVELDVLPLRQALVELYDPVSELIAKARRELTLLNEYTSIVDQAQGEEWTRRVNQIVQELEKKIGDPSTEKKTNDEEQINQLAVNLRAELKNLRETVAWYDKTYAIGEWTRACVMYWITATLLVTLLAGILPIVHSKGNWNLTILHWGVLGITGALLASLLQLHNLDLPELGETEGRILFDGTVRSVAIGAISAVVLYAALWGEALDGKIFPDIPTRPATDVYTQLPDKGESSGGTLNAQWEALKNIGLSVFWAVFAGLSPAVLRRMTRLAETSLGEPKSGGDEE